MRLSFGRRWNTFGAALRRMEGAQGYALEAIGLQQLRDKQAELWVFAVTQGG